jgi:hypothetical protein
LRFWPEFCFLLFAPLCFGAHNDDASLRSLYDAHRGFALRDAVAKSAAPGFYQGAVACAFNLPANVQPDELSAERFEKFSEVTHVEAFKPFSVILGSANGGSPV